MKKEQEEKEKELLRQELDQNFKMFKKQEKAAIQKNEELAATLEALKAQLKEKEQLQRISSLKISELKRSIKHGQLKPIDAKK